MSERPTPETDAVAAYEGNWDTKALRMTAHSRKLERERDEAREEIRDWKRLHDAAERGVDLTIAEGTISDLLKQRDEARRELKFLWRERDEARELLASEKITRNHIIKRSVEVERERDEAIDKYQSLQKTFEEWQLKFLSEQAELLHNKDVERDKLFDEAYQIRIERDETRESLKHIGEYGTEEINAAVELRQKLATALVERDEAREENAKLRDIAERAINYLNQSYRDGFADEVIDLRYEIEQLKEETK